MRNEDLKRMAGEVAARVGMDGFGDVIEAVEAELRFVRNQMARECAVMAQGDRRVRDELHRRYPEAFET